MKNFVFWAKLKGVGCREEGEGVAFEKTQSACVSVCMRRKEAHRKMHSDACSAAIGNGNGDGDCLPNR